MLFQDSTLGNLPATFLFDCYWGFSLVAFLLFFQSEKAEKVKRKERKFDSSSRV